MIIRPPFERCAGDELLVLSPDDTTTIWANLAN
jgi:hypothetical protein